MSRKFVYYGAGRSADELLLDLYPAIAGHSLRYLKTGIVYVIRVRRTGDNLEQDFTPLEIINGTLSSWVIAGGGTENGRVARIYGQGLSIDMIQPSSANQPFIVDTGVLITENGKPAISRRFSSGNPDTWMYAAHTFPNGDILTTNVFVGKRLSGTGYNAMVGVAPFNIGTDRRYINKSIESSTSFAVRLEGGNTIFNSGSGYVQSLFSSFRNVLNTDFKARRNGVDLSVASSGASKNLNIQSDSAFTIFHTSKVTYTSNGPPVDGVFQESIWWLNDESANLPAIETNINDYYAIY